MSTRPESRKLIKTRTPGVYKRGNRYVVVWRDARGKQHKESAPTYDAARRAKRAKDKNAQEGGHDATAHREPFGTYAREWVATYRGRSRKGVREETRKEYERDLELYAIPYFDRQQIGTITPDAIQDFLDWLRHDAPPPDGSRRKENGLSAGSVRNAYAPVRAMFADAIVKRHLTATPCAGVIVPVADTTADVKALTREQEEAVLGQLPDKWRLLVRFLLDTGMRISEAVALNVNSVDWATGEVHIKDRMRGHSRGAPKSVHGTRTIPLSSALLADLTAMRDDLSEQAPDDALWQSLRGYRFNQANIYKRVYKPAVRKAGVDWAGWHTLRHTAATRWLSAGIQPLVVSRLLGHATPAFTLTTYAHVLPEHLPSGDELAGATGGNS